MSGWGSMDFMRKSYENNRNLLGKHKSLKELYTENRLFENHSQGMVITRAKPRVIKRIREKLRIQNRRNRIKSIMVLILSVALVSFAFSYLHVV